MGLQNKIGRISLKQLLSELLNESTGSIWEPTAEGVSTFHELLKNNIKTPVFRVDSDEFGGLNPNVVYLIVGFDPKSNWTNNIFENSRYYKMLIKNNGSMEVHQSGLKQKSKNPYYAFESIPVKFRKAQAKSAQDVVSKIKKFNADIEKYYDSLDPSLMP